MSDHVSMKDGIYLDGSGLLKEMSKPVDIKGFTQEEHVALTALLIQMNKHDKAQGLSAVQIGYPTRVCIIRINGNCTTMINPKLVFKFWWQYSNEGCYSTRERRYWVWRPYCGIVFYYDIEFKPHFMKLNKDTIRVVCHEIDHMNGLLISRGKEYRKK